MPSMTSVTVPLGTACPGDGCTSTSIVTGWPNTDVPGDTLATRLVGAALRANVAVQARVASSNTVALPSPPSTQSSPLQPAKVESAAACATKVTTLPCAYVALQAGPP